MEEQKKNLSEEVVNEDELVVLVDEEDKEHTFQIIEVIELNDQEYAVLVPWDEKDDDSAIVLKIIEENGEEMLYDIEDDKEWETVVEYWNNYVDEE